MLVPVTGGHGADLATRPQPVLEGHSTPAEPHIHQAHAHGTLPYVCGCAYLVVCLELPQHTAPLFGFVVLMAATQATHGAESHPPDGCTSRVTCAFIALHHVCCV